MTELIHGRQGGLSSYWLNAPSSRPSLCALIRTLCRGAAAPNTASPNSGRVHQMHIRRVDVPPNTRSCMDGTRFAALNHQKFGIEARREPDCMQCSAVTALWWPCMCSSLLPIDHPLHQAGVQLHQNLDQTHHTDTSVSSSLSRHIQTHIDTYRHIQIHDDPHHHPFFFYP